MIVPLWETFLYLLNAPWLIMVCYIEAYDIYAEEMPQYSDQMYEMCNIKWEQSYITLWTPPDQIDKDNQN